MQIEETFKLTGIYEKEHIYSRFYVHTHNNTATNSNE